MFMLPMAALIATVEQVRADYAANDIERRWGNRRSAPSDYIFDRPVFLGKMRMGQDLANIGARAPAPEESPSPAAVASPAAAQGAAASSPPATQAASPSAGSSPATAPADLLLLRLRRLNKERRSPVRRHQLRVHLRQPFQPGNERVLLHRHLGRWRTPLRVEAARWHRARRLRARRGRSKQRVCRRCILQPGIIYICIRHVASISIRTCRHTVSFTKSDVSLESVRQMRCNFQVRTCRPRGGRLFRVTMPNASSPI